MLLALLAGLTLGQSGAPLPPEIENEQILGINKQPWHATLMPYANLGEALVANRRASSYARSLNGPWKFHYVPRPEQRPVDFYKPSYDVSGWKEISVPSNWQVLGYGTPYYRNNGYTFQRDWPRVMSEPPKNYTAYEERNPVGSYRRTFTVPGAWSGRRTFLTFDGVDSAFFLWINGQKVGYSQNSRNAAEFDITPYIAPGKPNLVALEVYRYSAGSYFEDQDMWRLSGIFRNVTLWSAPNLHVRDFFIKTDLDARYRDAALLVSAKVKNYGSKPTTGRSLTINVYDPLGKPVLGAKATASVPALQPGEEGEVSTSITIANPQKWTAETPTLYTTVMSLGNEEILSSKTGFRKIQIDGRLFKVNGVPVKLKGANRHEHWPESGHAVTEAQMIRDIEVLKQANCNHVRTCHYSDDPRWYELCDQYGIYLVAEANAESHGYYGVLDREPRFEKMVVDRNVANVENFKNHPSILIWSLGNECGGGSNFRACIPAIKKIDKTRPVHYEPFGIGRNNPADIDSQMYQSVSGTERIALDERKEFTKPFYLCEYAHAMFNSMGSIGDYNDVFDKYPELMGGAIWEWEDQGLWNRRDPKHPFLAYGGGFGEVPNDGYFIHKGVVFSDRTPKPHYPEAKRAYQWIGFGEDNLAEGKIKIRNKYAFTNLDKFDFSWQVTADGKPLASGKLAPIGLPPGAEKSLTLPIPRIKPGPRTEYFLNLTARLRKDESWAKAGYDVANGQFKLPVAWVPSPVTPSGSLQLSEDRNLVSLKGIGFEVSFDRSTGALTTLRQGTQNILLPGGGPQLHLWRSQHRNDDGYAASDWYRSGLLHLTSKTIGFTVEKATDGSYTVTSSIQYTGRRKFAATHVAVYHVYPDGTITVDNTVSPTGPRIVLARVGVRMLLDKKLNNVTYLARGPMENYSDRKRGSDVGLYSSTVKQQMTGYSKPMECGNHEDTRWVALHGTNEPTLVAQADGASLLQFSSLPWTDEEMEDTQYSVDLPPSSATVLCLSGRTLGAGSAGCGPRPLPQYMLYSDPASFSYILRLLPSGVNFEGRTTAPARALPVAMAYNSATQRVALTGGEKTLLVSIDNTSWFPYSAPFLYEEGKTFRVQSTNEAGLSVIATYATPTVPATPSVKVIASSYQPDEGEPENAVDGDPSSYWHTRWDPSHARPPHFLILELKAEQRIEGVRMTPRQDMENGRIKDYEIYVSQDGKEWGKAVASGSLPNTTQVQTVRFGSPVRGRFLRLVVLSDQSNGGLAAIAELEVLTSK